MEFSDEQYIHVPLMAEHSRCPAFCMLTMSLSMISVVHYSKMLLRRGARAVLIYRQGLGRQFNIMGISSIRDL